MGANNHKVVNAIDVIQSLPDRVVGTAQTLKAMFDNVGEIVRLKHNELCDYIDTDIATKSELQGITLGQIVDGTITEPKLSVSLQTSLIALNPAGSIITMATSVVPNGYLECDGSAVSRNTYGDLYTAIGETFGVGDGSTTFNLPDLRGEFIRGWDHGKGVDTGRLIGSSQAGSSGWNGGGSYLDKAVLDVENTYTRSVNSGIPIGSAGPAGTNTYGYIRPRNIALMYCIKY